ncbi:MAG: malto-oligosyltrehalose trehalohydrolase [Steroidobacteraceae bacterium]
MSRRRHEMPFGAQVLPDGRVRFRLWAPAARGVELVLESPGGPPKLLPMKRTAPTDTCETLGRGCETPWEIFELATDAARAGSRYRYRIDGEALVPDPASRRNPQSVHGPSEVVDPEAFEWTDANWRARPWRESVVYELHVGTFTPQGTFAAIPGKLEHLQRLGVTAIELMPIAEFPGTRGWGYDGVLPYAPASAYGSPEDLKSLICSAHAHGIAVMLDVVYNHFGPEGNFLHLYAPQFFTERHATPWGAAIDFERSRASEAPVGAAREVRDFFIHNALYWLEEYHLDGLRLDAVHAIFDAGEPHLLTEIAHAARQGPDRERPLYLVLENLRNEARWLGPPGDSNSFDAQWNDDCHHCLHVLLTGESHGYYEDYQARPHSLLCRSLAEGFVYQGESSRHLGAPRGERSSHLPPSSFVNFLQNHDQVGNRARGERLTQLARPEALRAAVAVLLLAPSPPMLFMGEEWAAPEPFPYFCDFEPELARKVRQGRLREFAHFQGSIPDPCAAATFAAAHLDWSLLAEPPHARMFDHYRRLLAIRRRDIVPLLPRIIGGACVAFDPGGAFAVDWRLRDDGVLHLLANLKETSAPVIGRPAGRMIFSTHPGIRAALSRNELAPWSVTWLLERSRGAR